VANLDAIKIRRGTAERMIGEAFGESDAISGAKLLSHVIALLSTQAIASAQVKAIKGDESTM
jgi:hypothetical protein